MISLYQWLRAYKVFSSFLSSNKIRSKNVAVHSKFDKLCRFATF